MRAGLAAPRYNVQSPTPTPPPNSSGLVSERTSGYQAPDWVALRGIDFSSMSQADLLALFKSILERKIHGIAFSPYVDDQEPGHEITEEQIRARLDILAPHVRWIRTFSCIEGHQHAPRIAHEEYGLKTMVGADLGADLEENEAQLAAGIEIANAGHADIFVVGNENMLRRDITEAQLLDYIARAKAAVPDHVPVSFVDAYFLFEQHPAVAEACDVLLVNCYPYWESCPREYALLYMKEMYRRAVKVAGGKKVIVSETGWPSRGTPFGAAVPSPENALRYFIDTYQWAEEDDIEIFYFAAFDEAWKVGAEGDVGAYWGLWDSKGNLKYT
jgi:exo-beta-1,3-glucanase (GH17 family)